MDVGEWLRGLGLDEYEGKFRDNKIDAEVLPHLTADDLKDIGVSAVGDRRKLSPLLPHWPTLRLPPRLLPRRSNRSRQIAREARPSAVRSR